MREVFVIKGIVNGGFWSNSEIDFKGFLFATKYYAIDSEDILRDLLLALNKCPCEIIKVFIKM